jgi:heptosyltransferase-2
VPKPTGADHQASYYQAIVAALGIANGPCHARVVPGAAGSPGLPDAYVVFAPGAAYGSAKQWPPERFAELAALIAGNTDWSVVLVGSGADRRVCRAIADANRSMLEGGRIVNLCGQTDLAALARVLAGSRAVVSNDSGAMHLAGAVGARVIAPFGATNEHRTSPLSPGPDAPPPIILTHPVWCRPCMLRECPIDHRCMTGISAARVFSALSNLA